jgi:hypothetical protein
MYTFLQGVALGKKARKKAAKHGISRPNDIMK